MTLFMGFSKEGYVYVRLANAASDHRAGPNGCNDEGVGMDQLSRIELLRDLEEEKEVIKDADLEGILLGKQGERKTANKEK